MEAFHKGARSTNSIDDRAPDADAFYMDIDDYNELKQHFESIPTAELSKIVSAKPGEYRDEALAAARDILATRPSVPIDHPVPPIPKISLPPPNQSPMERLDDLLDQLFNLNDVNQSVAAIDLLEAEATPEWLPVLHEILATPDESYLRASVTPAIIRLQGVEALPRLIAALRLGLAEGDDCDGLQALVGDLVMSEPAAACSILLPMAESAEPADRSDAAWLLGYAHAEVPPEVFLRLATDEIPRVRRAACGSLESLNQHEPAFQMLLQRLSDADEEVRISAISALGYYGDPRALPFLERLHNSVGPNGQRILEYSLSLLKQA